MDAAMAAVLLAATVSFAAPLIYASIGELVSEKAGVLNIQLEGMMLAGAFCGVWAAQASGSLVFGFLGAAGGGVAVSIAHGVLCFALRAEQVVSGVVLNILVLGVTTFANGPVFAGGLGRSVGTLAPLPIPYLSDLPIVGPALFSQDLMVYVALILIPVASWVLNKTLPGLSVQAVGESPEAARAMGVPVLRIRWTALMVCGALAGLGGGQLTLAGLGTFTQNVTAGRGFIALAAVVFGRWSPGGALTAVLIFTFAEAVQVRAQVLGVWLPYQLLVIAPYLLAVLALTISVGRTRTPAALGRADRI